MNKPSRVNTNLLSLALLILVSLSFLPNTYAAANSAERNAQIIQKLYSTPRAQMSLNEVVSVATTIVKNRDYHKQNTLAMTYALLSDVAHIKGEQARAFQFAIFGLTYKPIAAEVALNLKLKMASGYFFKGKYQNLIYFMEEVLLLAQRENNLKYQMLALAYRAMASAISGDYAHSLDDLLTVEKLIDENREFADYVELYELLAISQHYLGNDDVAISLYEKVLNKRFEQHHMLGIETTYVDLAGVYLNMKRYDDAYSAYWEAKKYASTRNLPIKIAYAELGLGKVYSRQGQHEKAFKSLVEAESLFKGQNLTKAYLSTLIELIMVSQQTGRVEFAEKLLMRAQDLADVSELTAEHSVLYEILADYYQDKNDSQQALTMLKRYVDLQKVHHSREKIPVARASANITPFEQSTIQTLKVVEASETLGANSELVVKQKRQNIILSMVCFALVFIIIFQWFRYRQQRIKFNYEQIEKPAYLLTKPSETKQLYHQMYKKARKYEYPLSIGYIAVKNWQDLRFQFNKRVANEVEKTIATIINEHLGEFDYAGQINHGEYLVIFPHQTTEESTDKLDKLIDAIKVRFFANLGDFSVSIGHSLNQPSVQDIDPYIFLSRLSDT